MGAMPGDPLTVQTHTLLAEWPSFFDFDDGLALLRLRWDDARCIASPTRPVFLLYSGAAPWPASAGTKLFSGCGSSKTLQFSRSMPASALNLLNCLIQPAP